MAELLLGCGASREKRLIWDGRKDWTELVTVDINPRHKPDFVYDISRVPLLFDDNAFDEIHAYDVLEHTGQQGDWRFFFRQFEDFWRILKPNGVICAVSPAPHSPWAWGDPGHTRIMSRECLIYLDQDKYSQVGETPMTDYRPWYRGNLALRHSEYMDNGQHAYVLQAVKKGVSDAG